MNTRTSKLIFPAILFLFACLIAFGENGPTPKVVIGASGISDGSVTNAKLAEPVSVANGGTGKTTAAEALTALGGASLNGSSTVNFTANALTTSAITAPAGGTSGYWGGTSGGVGFARVTLTAGQIASISTILTTIGVPGTALQRGRITITSFSGVQGTACIYISGSANAALEIDDVSTVFSVTKDTPTSTNIYSAGAGSYEIQNTHGGTVIYMFRWEGA